VVLVVVEMVAHTHLVELLVTVKMVLALRALVVVVVLGQILIVLQQ
jgi:hypothetical protein